MQKDFDKWNQKKKEIHNQVESILYNQREVWWCSLGVNIGVETDGKNDLFARPVIVFRKFNRDMLWALPLTSRPKPNKPFYFHFHLHSEDRVAILSQLRLVSSKRLIRRLGKISHNQFKALNRSMNLFMK